MQQKSFDVEYEFTHQSIQNVQYLIIFLLPHNISTRNWNTKTTPADVYVCWVEEWKCKIVGFKLSDLPEYFKPKSLSGKSI